MAIKWKSTEKKGGDLFRGAVSWLCFLLLLCAFTSGAFLLITVALDPSLAASIGDAVVRVTYGDYPRWVPVAGGCLVLFFAGLLALTIAFAQDRKAFETALARWLRRIWVEVKLLAIAGVLVASLFLGMFTNLGFWWAPFTAGVLVLYFLCLDIGKNRRFFGHNIIHSILKALTNYKAMTTFEQRSIRRLFAVIAVIVGVMGAAVFLLAALDNAGPFPGKELMLPALVLSSGAAVIGTVVWYVLALKQDLRDWNILMAQITEMYGGNLNAVNHVPPTSNLYDCAMQLNMIRTGIQKAVEEGTKADRTKVELITNVSHDIKTPLTSIISYVELLKKEPDLPPHVMDYVNTISQKADRLNHIVQDVFEVSKAATGNITLNLEDLDLGKLLQQTLGEMEQTMERSGLVWRVEIPDAPALVHTDGQRMYRVFQNLIRNCAQYSLEGSRVYVNMTTQPAGPQGPGFAQVSIRNVSKSEITMDAEHLTARFVRGDQNRTTEGSGLGLSIAKSFTEACGGRFGLRTDGDLFLVTVTFPLAARQAPAYPALPSEGAAPAGEEKIEKKEME